MPVRLDIVDAGIIPARAGFTLGRPVRVRRWPDHPRSRGVYWFASVSFFLVAGSSPLARGLHYIAPETTQLTRIIPARAGFTPARRRGIKEFPDHPRSRGVYPMNFITSPVTLGSSPLARGLRRAHRKRIAIPGIIPARAGFTLPKIIVVVVLWDHPRSRGVYITNVCFTKIGLGSSPLARGLLSTSDYHHFR